MAAAQPVKYTKLNANQIKGFWAAWGGWCLDGMDAFIYALVLAPALAELLPRSGIEVNPGNTGYWGSALQALFLLGWGASMIWGPIADRYGRVKALMWTILFYSIFTFMCGIVTSVYQLAFLRILCGIGLGGEQPMGGTFVAEEWPEDRRKMGAGYMHTGYYFGFFLAALANYLIAGLGGFSWRWMFVLGGAPALLVGWIQHGVNEPEAWKKTASQAKPKMIDSFKALFTEEYRMRTIINSALFTVSIIGLWSGSVYVPLAVTQLAVKEGWMYASMMFNSPAVCTGYMLVALLKEPRDLGIARDEHWYRIPVRSLPARAVGYTLDLDSFSLLHEDGHQQGVRVGYTRKGLKPCHRPIVAALAEVPRFRLDAGDGDLLVDHFGQSRRDNLRAAQRPHAFDHDCHARH